MTKDQEPTGTTWHGTEQGTRRFMARPTRKILARKILARPGTENIGTENDGTPWHKILRFWGNTCFGILGKLFWFVDGHIFGFLFKVRK